jgi:hypothetical protein
MDLSALLEPAPNLERLAKTLDEFGAAGRLHCIRGWNRNTQARLFEALAGAHEHTQPLTLDHFAPGGTALESHVHEGINSLPVFSQFQKRFARTESGSVVGYNHSTTTRFTGPGYFSMRAGDRTNELAIDYTLLPSERAATWPDIIPNAAKLGRFVFDGMVDHMRKLSHHVSIGRAAKGGKMMDAWFVLCRIDSTALRH